MRVWIRWMLLAAGTVAVALGVVGIVVPLLPTTPLLLLAAFCYARSSVATSGTTGPGGAYPCCRRC